MNVMATPDQAPEPAMFERGRVNQSIAQRLKAARQAAGYRSVSDAVRALGVKSTTYFCHENGTRGIPEAAARHYAKAFGVPVTVLLHGEEVGKPLYVPIVGVISAGGVISDMGDVQIGDANWKDRQSSTRDESSHVRIQRELEHEFPLPSFINMQRMVIVDNSMFPAYKSGDVIYFRPLRRNKAWLEHLHAQDCVVETTDGRKLLRTVMVQPNGLTTLLARMSDPPEIDVEVLGIAPVEFIQRGRRDPAFSMRPRVV